MFTDAELRTIFANSPTMFSGEPSAPAATEPAAPPAPSLGPAPAAGDSREAQLKRMFYNSPGMFAAESRTGPEEQQASQAARDGAAKDTATGEQKKPAADAPAELAIKLPDQLPEGRKGDQKFVDAYVAMAQKHGLSQEQAQGVADHFIAEEVAQDKAWETRVTGWRNAVHTDQEIGGQAFEHSIRAARSIVEEFGTKGFVAALADSGLGNHPEMVRLLARAGRALRDAREGKVGSW
jgi:hypothetical protein